MRTAKEILQIRRMRGHCTAQECGSMFDLAAETVRRIWRRETYASIPEEEGGSSLPTEVELEALQTLDNLTRNPP